jgi:TPR repeat protein/predicted Ser/Thr protein kinase
METPPISTQALPPGTRIEEFVIESVLGSGGFGITYLARDTALGRQVVIKENLPVQFCFRDPSSLTVAPRHSQSDDADNFQWSLENFSKEAAMLASLHHPGIVQVLRSFQAFGTAYFVMPYVEGVTLEDLLQSRQQEGQSFAEDELRGLIERVLAALDHLHQRGIYHRDIKPGNILITSDGIPVLIDFGSARQRLGERSMTVIESAGYTPFEQLESRGNVGPWSDLYALGGTLEKALTGKTPPKVMDRMRRDPHVSLAGRPELCASYSSVFLRSIDKALQVQEPDRWQDAVAWLDGLRKQGDEHSIMWEPHSSSTGSVTARPRSTGSVAKGRPRYRKAMVWGYAAVPAVAGLAFFGLKLANENVPDRGTMASQSDGSRQGSDELRMDKLLERARGGDAYAQALVGYNLLYGPAEVLSDGERTKKEMEALEWLEKSRIQGHPLGMAIRGSAENFLKRDAGLAYAKRCYLDAVSAGLMLDLERRSAVWVIFAATAYQMGWGVEQSAPEAVKWYLKAADAGNAMAMSELGLYNQYGIGLGKKNEIEAVYWFRKAADAGYAEAMARLGFCYQSGIGVAKNEPEAVKWYRKAADAGDAKAMARLGFCYLSGIGVAKNAPEAIKWYREAADAGDALSMVSLGFCYEEGTGTAKDEFEAVKLYRKASDLGNEEAAEFAAQRLKEIGK